MTAERFSSLRGLELDEAVRGLSSVRAAPWPPDLEAAPSEHEVLVGAFVCCVFGLVARGRVELAFDESETALWIRAAERTAVETLPVESALLEHVHETSPGGYRDRLMPWHDLATIVARAAHRMPSREEIVLAVARLDFADEMIVEHLAHAYPGVVSTLARVAEDLFRH